MKLKNYSIERVRLIVWLIVALAGLVWLLLYRLGNLTGGLSSGELAAANAPVGWHGIYHAPLDLPLKLTRSVVFYIFPEHGQTLTRFPNIIFGALAAISFTWLIKLWHSKRTAALAGLLFAAGAWTLHASRLASFDVLYLWAMPTLLLTHVLISRYTTRGIVWWGCWLVWGLMLYVPGMVWLLIVEAYLLRGRLLKACRHFGSWRNSLYLLASLMWLPLLLLDFKRHGEFLTWLGAPEHFAAPWHLLKQLGAVPVHLFVQGPQYPDIWLGKAPILDIFALAACVIGIYFYVTHLKASRTRLLASMAIVGAVLVAIEGRVGLSLLVPLLYVGVATGIAYLLRQWTRVFPNNPLARGLGLGLVILAISLSCLYNLRAYFVAWPHNHETKKVFRYHR